MSLGGMCPRCGTPFGPDTIYCSGCGALVGAPEAAGAPAPPSAPPPPGQPAPPPPAGATQPLPTMPPPGAPAAVDAAALARKKTNTNIVIGGVIAVLVLIAGAVFLSRDDDKGSSTGSSTSTPAVTTVAGSTTSLPDGTLDPTQLGPGEVLLEPVNSETVTPFTPSARTSDERTPTVSLPQIPMPTTTAPLTEGQVPLSQVNGNVPGLYGGTRNAAECDQQSMISYLEANPDKAAAWAGVQGIQVGELRSYIESLTPVVLTRDTRVTNHGFRNGQAFAHPSVLQAGHAVLVDRWGIPRAKCSCGNPLTPPTPLSQPPTYVGPQWPTFDPTIIIVVVVAEPVTDGFVIVDVDSGELIIRTVGATPGTPDLATGDVRVTLRWSDAADLDLSVTDPMGETVSYSSPGVTSGGTLDVDANSSCNEVRAAPAENIIWSSDAPDGRYLVTVDLYDSCGAGDAHAFVLEAVVGGVPVQLYQGVADAPNAPVDGSGVVSSAASTVTFVFDVGTVTDTPSGSDPARDGALDILDHLLLDCGVDGTYTDGGLVEGGWRWIVTTPDGDASFVVYDPTGDWVVQPEDELAGSIAVTCGFYSE